MKILTKGQYYGSKNQEKSFNGILLSHYKYVGAKTDWHYHENPYFMYVLHGNMMDSNTRVKTLCPAGTLMFNNWQESHFGSKHSKLASGFHLEFERAWFEKNGISLDLLEGSQRIQNPQVHFLFAKLFREFMLSDQYSDVSVETILLQICDALGDLRETNTQKTPPWIQNLKELLHYDPANLSLKHLAQQLGVHPVHISRAVPKYLSVSLGEYIRQDKIKKAIPLLFDPTVSLTEITYQVGFSDQSHFNRVFKSYFNMTPGLYRKKLLKA